MDHRVLWLGVKLASVLCLSPMCQCSWHESWTRIQLSALGPAPCCLTVLVPGTSFLSDFCRQQPLDPASCPWLGLMLTVCLLLAVCHLPPSTCCWLWPSCCRALYQDPLYMRVQSLFASPSREAISLVSLDLYDETPARPPPVSLHVHTSVWTLSGSSGWKSLYKEIYDVYKSSVLKIIKN